MSETPRTPEQVSSPADGFDFEVAPRNTEEHVEASTQDYDQDAAIARARVAVHGIPDRNAEQVGYSSQAEPLKPGQMATESQLQQADAGAESLKTKQAAAVVQDLAGMILGRVSKTGMFDKNSGMRSVGGVAGVLTGEHGTSVERLRKYLGLDHKVILKDEIMNNKAEEVAFGYFQVLLKIGVISDTNKPTVDDVKDASGRPTGEYRYPRNESKIRILNSAHDSALAKRIRRITFRSNDFYDGNKSDEISGTEYRENFIDALGRVDSQAKWPDDQVVELYNMLSDLRTKTGRVDQAKARRVEEVQERLRDHPEHMPRHVGIHEHHQLTDEHGPRRSNWPEHAKVGMRSFGDAAEASYQEAYHFREGQDRWWTNMAIPDSLAEGHGFINNLITGTEKHHRFLKNLFNVGHLDTRKQTFHELLLDYSQANILEVLKVKNEEARTANPGAFHNASPGWQGLLEVGLEEAREKLWKGMVKDAEKNGRYDKDGNLRTRLLHATVRPRQAYPDVKEVYVSRKEDLDPEDIIDFYVMHTLMKDYRDTAYVLPKVMNEYGTSVSREWTRRAFNGAVKNLSQETTSPYRAAWNLPKRGDRRGTVPSRAPGSSSARGKSGGRHRR